MQCGPRRSQGHRQATGEAHRAFVRRGHLLLLRREDVRPVEQSEVHLQSLPQQDTHHRSGSVFHEQLKNFFFSSEELAAHLKQVDSAIKEKDDLLAVLSKERAKLAGTIDKLHDLYQSGAIDKAGFGAKYHPLAERQRQLDDEIPKNQAELDVMKIAHLSKEEIVSEARDLYGRWPILPIEERRRIVEAITERITIGKDEVEIDLFYVPPHLPAPPRSARAAAPL